jgi:hypothetical protein
MRGLLRHAFAVVSLAGPVFASDDPQAFVERNNPGAKVEIVAAPAVEGPDLAELAFGGGAAQAMTLRRTGLGALNAMNWTGTSFAAGPSEAVSRNAAFDLSTDRMTGLIFAPDGRTQIFLPMSDGRLLKISDNQDTTRESGDPLTCTPEKFAIPNISRARPEGFYEACPKRADTAKPVADVTVLIVLDADARAYFAALSAMTGANQEKAFVDRLMAGANLSFVNSGVRMAFRPAGEPVALAYEFAMPGQAGGIMSHRDLVERIGAPSAARAGDAEFLKLRDIRKSRKADLVAVIVGRKDIPDSLTLTEAEAIKDAIRRNPSTPVQELQKALRLRPYRSQSREGCGTSLQLDAKPEFAIAVMARGCAEAKMTFIHEMGHLMGAQHACDGIAGLAPYAHGAHFRAGDGRVYRTIMAKCEGPGQNSEDFGGNCPPRLPVWSQAPKPGQSVAYGTPMRDNARLLNCVAADVARNGESLSAGTAKSVPRLPPVTSE